MTPPTQTMIDLLARDAAPETLERQCQRNIAERELRWMKERREVELVDGRWKLVR